MEHKLTFEAYNEALKQNKLLGLKCKECDTITAPPKMACRKCASRDMEVITLTGKGKIQTFTTVYVAPEGFRNEVPYTIVMVELDEGPWLMGNLTGIDPKETTTELIGKKVKMEHKVAPDDEYSANSIATPLFRLEA